MNLINIGVYSALAVTAVSSGLLLATFAAPGDAQTTKATLAPESRSTVNTPDELPRLTLSAPRSEPFDAKGPFLELTPESQLNLGTQMNDGAALMRDQPAPQLTQPLSFNSGLSQPSPLLQMASYDPSANGLRLGQPDNQPLTLPLNQGLSLAPEPRPSVLEQAAMGEASPQQPLLESPQVAALSPAQPKSYASIKANILEEAQDVAARFFDSEVDVLKFEGAYDALRPSLLTKTKKPTINQFMDNLDLSNAKYGMNTPLPDYEEATQIIVFKSQRLLHLMQNDVLLKSYKIDLGFNPVGHKLSEGDGKTPEGDYVIDWRNENSQFHRALHISYPNLQDTQIASLAGRDPGGAIMIHGRPNSIGDAAPLGADWTAGCIAVTNDQMDELMGAVADTTPISIRP